MKEQLDKLEKAIGYSFKDQQLLQHALRHRSVGGASNERLEFLGDGVVNFVIAAELFGRYRKLQEGELSKLRSNLVRRDTLAEIAAEFKLGDYMSLGIGERKSGGHRRASILADALEAVVGAMFLDAGFEVCRDVLQQWFGERLENINLKDLKDPKTALQEYLQAHKCALPSYEIVATEGKSHQQIFYVECQVEGLDVKAQGRGTTVQAAEKEAAQNLLHKITEHKIKQ